MEDFDAFLDQCWTDHASEPRAVVERLVTNTAEATPDQLPGIVRLGAHLYGEHLGEWQAGIDWLEGLGARADVARESEAASVVRRSRAALELASGATLSLDDEPPSERVRIHAMAASALGERDLDRARQYFEQAAAEADALSSDDPAHRALAVTANNLAADLEEKRDRIAVQTELMLAAAGVARKHWEIAGTWLEVERAEYRLAKAHLSAGHLERARTHAEACLSLCQLHDDAALELFWAHEALACIAKASGNANALRNHVAEMQRHLGGVDASLREWCEGALSGLG
jgi:hypothetical protein